MGGTERQALYLAAMSAITYNPPLAATYRRLVTDGKKPMVALGAVMRKLLARKSHHSGIFLAAPGIKCV